ncbi:hypothetical protein MGYG_03870 [Nannizzia gypsea CBS 118893]|uniref:Uncharacterized protein n=1 Tax=Arthroderma gypseum (strain ATCC MYA-4604 / CBS 118893) TaxID=535722 RepID=E4UUA0_ARTGP|nr:hypothetical protein MGYG_03870 [Nannizzia gypsea CBS 118893]EFR00867.1 hypothetical protein MGYG_03870 [Nannizzia gypsea CBS 118893]
MGLILRKAPNLPSLILCATRLVYQTSRTDSCFSYTVLKNKCASSYMIAGSKVGLPDFKLSSQYRPREGYMLAQRYGVYTPSQQKPNKKGRRRTANQPASQQPVGSTITTLQVCLWPAPLLGFCLSHLALVSLWELRVSLSPIEGLLLVTKQLIHIWAIYIDLFRDGIRVPKTG